MFSRYDPQTQAYQADDRYGPYLYFAQQKLFPDIPGASYQDPKGTPKLSAQQEQIKKQQEVQAEKQREKTITERVIE